MKIRVFQIDHNKDKNHAAFSSLDKLGNTVDPSIYRQIYGGEVGCKNLEDVFFLCNLKHPPGYCGESMSVSNVVEVCDGDNKGFYYCDSVGFKPIEFDISKTDHDKMLSVLIVQPKTLPYVAEIRDCLEAKQSVVGGLIEPVYFDYADKALIYCDEEFLLKGYEPCRCVGNIVIHGTFMIVGNGTNEYGEGIEVSLTEDQLQKYTDMFSNFIVRIPTESVSEDAVEEFEISQ